ncbi:AAA family ATPase [Exiguobacterium sp. s50]|uniref:AAA family ATPase n=1 Tax=Exiguobacterium sp. s50 TaxID=2751234 RepID=UPI001BEA734C|nr:AAA family ATPase [Exiguobacterium sp. s50]
MRLQLKEFYGNSHPEFPLDENLTIYIGNNGSGKTTLLNVIHNILSCDFNPLFDKKFEEIVIEFDKEDYTPKVRGLVWIKKIRVTKTNNVLNIEYTTVNGINYLFEGKKTIYPFVEINYEVKGEDLIANLPHYYPYGESLLELISYYEELQVLTKQIRYLKNSILYFPTYRRIDSDLLSLLEQNNTSKVDMDFEKVAKLFESLPENNKLVGINDNDIDQLFQKYTFELQKRSSLGLNTVLKKLISTLIENTFQSKDSTSIRIRNKKVHSDTDSAEKLIDLANQLKLRNVDYNSIKDYFSLKESNLKNEIEDKIAFEERLDDHDKIIRELISLYSSHLLKMETLLKPFDFLQDNFTKFFKNRLNLHIDEKSFIITQSKSFKDLSTGEKQLVTILSYSSLLKSIVYRPLIIIDEPELSLHLKWQLELIPTLLELPNKPKLLIATHSPYIANHKFKNNIWAIGETDDI